MAKILSVASRPGQPIFFTHYRLVGGTAAGANARLVMPRAASAAIR
jgi:hypothetical protein